MDGGDVSVDSTEMVDTIEFATLVLDISSKAHVAGVNGRDLASSRTSPDLLIAGVPKETETTEFETNPAKLATELPIKSSPPHLEISFTSRSSPRPSAPDQKTALHSLQVRIGLVDSGSFPVPARIQAPVTHMLGAIPAESRPQLLLKGASPVVRNEQPSVDLSRPVQISARSSLAALLPANLPDIDVAGLTEMGSAHSIEKPSPSSLVEPEVFALTPIKNARDAARQAVSNTIIPTTPSGEMDQSTVNQRTKSSESTKHRSDWAKTLQTLARPDIAVRETPVASVPSNPTDAKHPANAVAEPLLPAHESGKVASTSRAHFGDRSEVTVPADRKTDSSQQLPDVRLATQISSRAVDNLAGSPRNTTPETTALNAVGQPQTVVDPANPTRFRNSGYIGRVGEKIAPVGTNEVPNVAKTPESEQSERRTRHTTSTAGTPTAIDGRSVKPLAPFEMPDFQIPEEIGSIHRSEIPEQARRTEFASDRLQNPRPLVAQIADAVRRLPDGVVEVRLAPEELGRIRLSMTPSEIGMTVHVLAENGGTLELMRRHIDILESGLRHAGYSGLSFSFSQNGRDDRSGRQTGTIAHPNSPNGPGKPVEMTSIDSIRTNLANGRIDLRL